MAEKPVRFRVHGTCNRQYKDLVTKLWQDESKRYSMNIKLAAVWEQNKVRYIFADDFPAQDRSGKQVALAT